MRRQLVIFLILLAVTAVVGIVYQARVLADLTRHYRPQPEALGVQLILRPNPAAQLTTSPVQATQTNLLEAQQVINARLQKLNVIPVQTLRIRNEHLEVTLPEDQQTPYVINIITSIGKIEFIDGGLTSPPIGQRIQIGPYARPERHIYPALFSGQDVEQVVPPDTGTGQIFYELTLAPDAAQRFAGFNAGGGNSYLCMVVDERVVNCSSMYHQIGQAVGILPNLGSGTTVSLADLAVFLESGPLPLPLNVTRP